MKNKWRQSVSLGNLGRLNWHELQCWAVIKFVLKCLWILWKSRLFVSYYSTEVLMFHIPAVKGNFMGFHSGLKLHKVCRPPSALSVSVVSMLHHQHQNWAEQRAMAKICWGHVSSYLLTLICNFHECHDQINLEKHNPDCWGRETLNTGLLTSCYWPWATASCSVFMLERWNCCSWMHSNI